MKARGTAAVAALAFSAMAFAGPLAGQVTTHPRAMGLPAAPSPRPDPGDHRLELANGLVAYLATDGSAPLVTLSALIGAGSVDGSEGAAEVLAGLLRARGPEGETSEAFHSRLESMAADFSVTLEAERLEIVLDVPADDARAAMSLLAALLTRMPEVQGSDVDQWRRSISAPASAEATGESGPVLYEGSLASAAGILRDRLLSGTSYGSPGPTAADLTTGDVRDFYDRFFVSGNIVLAAAGALDRATLESMVGEAFEEVRTGRRHVRQTVPVPPLAPDRTLVLYPADKLQGWLVLGTVLPVVPREHEAALEIMNYILGGGHFDTRLFRETRDKRGLTNDDSGFLEPNGHGPGVYTFQTYGRPEAVRLLLDLTIREAERIREAPVTDEELFVAKGALAEGVFAARYRDGWATARSFAEEWIAHGDHGWSATYQERVRAVTVADVQAAARRFLHPDSWTGVLIGPLEAIEAAPALEGEGSLDAYGTVVRVR